MRTRTITIGLLAAVAGVAALPMTGAFEPPTAADKQARMLLKEAHQHATKAATFSGHTTQAYTMEMMGMKQEMATTHRLTVSRPGQVALVLVKGDDGPTIVSDGKTLSYFVPMVKAYIEKPAPANWEVLFDEEKIMELGMLDPGPMPMLSPIFSAEGFKRLDDKIDSGEIRASVLGREDIDGTSCNHVKLVMPVTEFPGAGAMGADGLEDVTTTLDLWIGAGDPIVHRMKPDMSAIIKAMAGDDPQMANMNLDVTIDFNDWTFNEKPAEDAFVFTAPEGAKKYDSIMDAFANQGGAPPPSDALVGNTAPNFTVDLLDGSSVTLADHKGKDVVVLDFWATWCGPCVQALPILSKVTSEFADQGVVFYAVDLRETDEKVRAFLKQKKLDLTVAMDRDGAIGQLYKVEGIPQSVIIGRDGTVQAVHVGMAPGLETRLREELETLVKGGTLTEG